jgi:hypothetical protein
MVMAMDRIANGIWISGYREACDAAALHQARIDAVLQLYGPEPEPLPLPAGPEVHSLRVLDGAALPPEALSEGVGFLRTHRGQGHTVLVTCGLGQSRSAVFVAAYLHEQRMDMGMPLRRWCVVGPRSCRTRCYCGRSSSSIAS